MRIIYILILILLFFQAKMSAQCGPATPSFTVNLTGNPSGVWNSPFVIRNDNCCGTTNPDRCVKFVITLDPAAVGVNFNIVDGAVPGGALFYQINCGPPTPLGSPICLSGPGPHIITFCKPGNNDNVYQISSIPAPTGGTNVVINDGCIGSVTATGYNASTVVWSSISPGTPGQYNSYLSCTSGCLSPTVTGAAGAPAFVDYRVCGQPAAMCNFATTCDTVRVTFNPTLGVTIAPLNPTICFGQTSTSITATGSGGTPPYSYLWNNSISSQTINVGVGTFNVQLTDASGCPPTFASVTVTQFSVAISANAGADQTKCSQNPVATINASVTGASGGIWSGGGGNYSPTNTTLNNLVYTPTAAEISAGSATLILTTTGNGSCPLRRDTVKINYLPFTGTPAATVTNVSCFGGTNGSAVISVTGGPTPYTYSWNTVPAQTGTTASNLAPGTYTATITDGIGCVAQTTVAVTQPTPVALASVISNVSCNGGNNGSIAITPSGGTPGYTYSWAPGGQTTASVSGLIAGVYTVTVRDSKNCLATGTYTITQPPVLTASLVGTSVNCSGGSNGTATSTVAGGTAPYTYSWSPGGLTAPNATGLMAGIYTLTVTDNLLCVVTATVTIIQPTPLVVSTTSTNETCDYLNNGTATAVVSGGTTPYTYAWQTGGQTAVSISSLASGTYSLTVTDAKGCTGTAFATITQPVTLTPTFTSQTNVSCFGGNNGSVTASATGGTPNYTYGWAPGALSGATASGLASGTYTVTVTDNNTCTAQNTVTITQPAAPLSVTSVIVNVSCSGGSNGSIAATPAGGTSPYTYLWTPGGQTGSTATSLTSGTYSLTVTDSKGCTTTATYTVTQPLPLATTLTPVHVSCFGGSNGSISSSVSGGTATYTYLWSPGGTTNPTVSGLPIGTYSLTVTDNLGCILTTTVAITQPPVLFVSTTPTNETCNYLNNGSALATVTGGTINYSYSWLPGGQTTATATALASGVYTVTVTDSKGCVATSSVTIAEPLPIAISFGSQVNVSCFGGNNGSVTASATGGTPNYTYGWAPGALSGATASGLASGTYTVTVTDNNTCTAQNTVTITQPAAPLSVTSVIVNVSCSGGSNGSIAATPAGGTSPYTYLWTPGGQTGSTATSLTSGTYSLTVTDSKGCTTTATYTVTQPLPLATTLTPVHVSCFGGSNGSISSSVSGGTATYTYLWSPGGTTNPTVSGLPIGTYSLTVTDNLGCILTTTVTLTQPPVLFVSTTPTNETCNYLNNGSALATVTGGTINYSYSWLPGGQTTATATALASGVYTVTVTDSKGCVATSSATIAEPLPIAISFGSQTNVSCFGGNNGSVTASATGGTPNYTYGWAPGALSGATASGLASGTYTVTVTDNNTCTAQNTVTITQPAVPLSVSATSTPTSCFGGSNGTATATAAGGTTPYASYTWQAGNLSGASVAGLTAATYTVTSIDAKGCAATNTVAVGQPAAIVPVTSTVNSTCNFANGQASVSVTGGAPPYTYSWSPSGGTGTTATGLLAGPYNVLVTDNNGCTMSQFANVNDLGGPQASIFSTTNVSCFGGSDGSATASVLGGTGAITFSWSPIGGNATVASGLPAGVYTVTVTDANGCESSATTSPPILQPPQISIAVTTTNVNCFGGTSGTASAVASGGTPGFTYLWLPSNATGPSISGLAAGTYTVRATDTKNCTFDQTFTITQPAAALAVSTSATPVSCFGGSNGTTSSLATGGTTPYSFTWMAGSISGQNISNLPAGTYTINVTDSKGCTASNTASVTQPTIVTLTPASVNSTCGSSNGQASVVAGGGTPTYSYLWTPSGGSSSTAIGLASGTYTVSVTDNNGCVKTSSVTVNNTPGPAASISAITNVSCNGGSDATATVSVTGGTGTMDYLWAPTGGTAATATGLTIGFYTVTVTDDNGCQVQASTSQITQPPVISINVTTANVSCFGGSNGTATAAAAGGTPGFTYLWLPSNATGSSISGLAPGTYTVRATDTKNCTFDQTFTITQPAAALAVSTSATPVSCFGGSNGTTSSLATGGTTPYSFTWMAGSISGQNISNLPAGTYTINVTDSKGCTASNTASVTQPTIVTLTPASVNSTCGSSNGQASVVAGGGTPTYSYLWTPSGGSSSTAIGLASGTYTVSVTDNNGCVKTSSVTVNNTPGPAASISAITNVSCNGGSDATATVSVTGGTGTMDYLWAPTGGTAATATGLTIGFYTVTVTDDNGCQVQASTSQITQPPVISINVTTANVSCFGGSNGTATAAAAGGTPGFTYLWLPSNATGSSISGLAPGTYTVRATDTKNCTFDQTYTITQPASAVSVSATSSAVLCFGGNSGSTNAVASGGVSPYTYVWLPGSSGGPSLSNLITGNYTVNATDSNGCIATATINVSQPAQALSATSDGDSAACFGGSDGIATVTATGGTTNYSYQWNPTGGSAATATGLASGDYTVVVTDQNGCQTNSAVSIGQPTEIDGILIPVNPSCGLANGSITSQVSGGTSPYTYLWTPGNVTTSSINGIAPGTYSLQVTDALNCSKTYSVSLTNIPNPIVTTFTTINTSCFGGSDGSASVVISSGTPPYTINWSPTGGNDTVGINLFAGTYTVSVTDQLGCPASTTLIINEPTPVSINISAVNNALCKNSSSGSISVAATGGTPGYTYTWAAPLTDTTSTANNLAAGTYTVNAFDQNNCTHSISIMVNEPDSLLSAIGSVTNPVCFNGPGSASVIASGGTTPYSYAWSTSPVQTGNTLTDVPNGTYIVVITDANGCIDTNTVTIAQPQPVVTSVGANDTICLGTSTTISATATGGSGGYIFSWQPGGAVNSGTLNVAPTTETSYVVIAYDQNGCSGNPDTINVVVYSLSAANIEAYGSTPICPGQSSTIYVLATGSTGPLTYTWNNGLGMGPGAFLVTPFQPTTYAVTVSSSCASTVIDSIAIQFNPQPTIQLLADTNKLCAPESIQFNDASITGNVLDPITSWLWVFGDGSSSTLQNPSHTFNNPGTYNVSLTVATDGGCTSNNTGSPFTINAYPYPTAFFTINDNHIDLPNESLTTNNLSMGAVTYSWNFGDGNTSTLTSPQHQYTTVGFFDVTLISTNQFGCASTYSLSLETDAEVVFPNAFTPNTSGPGGGAYSYGTLTNDVFFPYTSGVVDYKLQVFNRWGELIFESNDIKQGWDGYYRGKLCQQDVYVWKAYLKLNNGKEFNKTGDVTLLQ